MSRAFTKEPPTSAPPPERMVDDAPNLVTQAGYDQITAHVTRLEDALKSEPNILLRETLERDLRYWANRAASAQIIPPPQSGTVAFGSAVTIARGGRTQSFRIVGVDEGDPTKSLISFRSPLATAILGAAEGDIIEAPDPLGEITVLSAKA